MNSAQQGALQRTLQTLTAFKAKFHIVLEDGTEFGAPVEAVKGRRGRQGPGNAEYVRSHILDMKVGDVKEAPPQDGDTLQRLQSSMASIASATWGNKTYTTAMEPSKGVVSIFREA